MTDALDCAKPVREILAFMTDEDLKNYFQDVLDKSRENNRRGVAAIRTAQEEIEHTAFNELVANYFENAQSSIQNYKMLERNKLLIEKGMTLRNIIARDSSDNFNKSNNVESAMRAEQNYLMNKFLENVNDDDLPFFINPDNQLEIAKAMVGEKNVRPEAQRIGEALKKYVDERTFKSVESHSLSLRHVNKTRFLKMSHDPGKLQAGFLDKIKALVKGEKIDYQTLKNQWINYIWDRLDKEATFARTKADKGENGIDEGIARDILDKIYDNIITGNSDIVEFATKFKDLNLLQRKKEQFFEWKDAQSWIEYNKQYGTGDLYSAFLADVHGSGSRIGMARIMGSKPIGMYKKLAEYQQKTNPKTAGWMTRTGHIWGQVTGADNRVVSPTLATIGSNIRQWTAMGSLFTLPIQSLNDMNLAASWMKNFHTNYGVSFIKQMDTVFRGQFTDAGVKKIARQFYVHVNAHAGYMGRFVEAQNMGQLTNKLSTQYFTKTGTMAWDRGNQSGTLAQTATALEQQSHLSYEKLPRELQKLFNMFSITPEEWDVLRTKNENKMFTLDNVERLTNDELRQLNKANPDRALYEVRNEIYRKVFSMFDAGTTMSIMRPGAYEKAFMYWGLKPGTIPGEGIRMLMQFKGFPISYVMRQLVMGYKNADTTQAKLYWGLQQFGYTLPLSYVSTYMYFAMQGKTMPDPTKMNWSEQVDFYMGLFAGPLSSLNNVWAGENHNSKDMIMSLFSNPSMRLLGSTAALPFSLAEKEPDKAKKNARDAFLSVFPLTNTPFASPYIRHALGQKPYLQPGQQVRPWAPQQ